MMKKELLSGVALVTEASSGIGKATAIAFAQAGAEVVPAARQIKESEEVVVKIRASGGKAVFVQTDVSQAGVINNSEERLGDKQVWLVLFEGEWQEIVPPAPGHPVLTPEPPTHGCVYVIIDQNDVDSIEGGTMNCSP